MVAFFWVARKSRPLLLASRAPKYLFVGQAVPAMWRSLAANPTQRSALLWPSRRRRHSRANWGYQADRHLRIDAGSAVVNAIAVRDFFPQPREIENTINTSEHMVIRNELSQ